MDCLIEQFRYNKSILVALYQELLHRGNYEALPMFTGIFPFHTTWKYVIKFAPINSIKDILELYEIVNIYDLYELYRLSIYYERLDVAKLIRNQINLES